MQDEQTILSWLPHIEACQGCSKTWNSYQRMFATLRETPVPQLPDNFHHQLQHQLRRSASRRSLGGPAKLAMRLYWILASLACFYISSQVSWPQELPPAAWIVTGLMGLAMMAAVLGILRKPSNVFHLALRILE
jgi:anti-sigma factor RsiW